MSNRNSKFDWRGLWLAIPAIAFLMLYMTAQEFTIVDHVIAFVFVALLAIGTLSMQHRQQRERLERSKLSTQEQESPRTTKSK